MNKKTSKYEKEKQKRIKRLFRKARIKKDASRDQIDANTIGYFKKKGVDTKVSLLDEQCDDPMFLISLYKSAPDTMWQFPPREENKKMVLNTFFMAEYIKLKAERESKLCSKDALESVVWSSFRRYRDCALNPEFVALIGNKYPEIDIISAVKNAVITHNYYINKEEEKKQIEEYTTLLNALPKELLEREVRKHGEYILKKLPRSLPGFTDLICVGIEHDGFKSVSLLDVDNILEKTNKSSKKILGSKRLKRIISSVQQQKTLR